MIIHKMVIHKIQISIKSLCFKLYTETSIRKKHFDHALLFPRSNILIKFEQKFGCKFMMRGAQ